ncbi:dipeptide epimerase [candidate division KSB1 bacterium]|nr:dipeptide epimerase [candidate division KSB1 bacterium]
MKISTVEFWPVDLHLSEPYTIAYETIEHTTNIFLRLETNTGIIGCGCAAPDKEITGETAAIVIQKLNEIVPLLKGEDPLRPVKILELLKTSLEAFPSTRAAVDMALFDIMGKSGQIPLWKLLGGYRDCIKTSITIGIMPEKKTTEKAREFVKQGFTSLKIKGGVDVESDIVRILKVREAVGPNIQIRFDANQGYTVESAIRFFDQTRSAQIEIFEQPTPKGELKLLGHITQKISIPVMADESLLTLRDAYRLTRDDLIDMVNIKLMKVGGILEAAHINSVAKAAHCEVMVGCMDESALAIAAGLHFALARPNVTCADLDGHIGLIGDPAADAVILKNGVLYPQDKPGLGWRI